MQLFYTTNESAELYMWPSIYIKFPDLIELNEYKTLLPRSEVDFFNMSVLRGIPVHSLIWMKDYFLFENMWLGIIEMRWDCINGWTK